MVKPEKFDHLHLVYQFTAPLKKNIFPKDLHSLSILGKKDLLFLTPNFFIFVSKRFAMLHIFYKQLRST